MASPYYLFGYQRRYPFAWHGGPGGVPWSKRAAETMELGGSSDLVESGIEPYAMHFPALGQEGETDETPAIIASGDWPALRPAGPEPLDPGEAPMGLGLFDTLSDNEKRLLMFGTAGVAAYWWFFLRKPKRRRAPARRRSTRRRRRR